MNRYLFTSSRLGFRNWKESDIPEMTAINQDKTVMEFFSSLQSEAVTCKFINRMMSMYEQRGYCYFAVEELESERFIGFIGLCYQDYEAPFTPCVDIGWRLSKTFWGKGYAT